MAKRPWDARTPRSEQPQMDSKHTSSLRNSNIKSPSWQRSDHRQLPGHPSPAKKPKFSKERSAATDISIAQDAKSQADHINDVRGVSLMLQLLDKYANNSESWGRLRPFIGDEALAQTRKLHDALKPREKAINQALHQSPKLPESGRPLAVFPTRLCEALNKSAIAGASSVPPLPEILDPTLRETPFVHRSRFLNDHKGAIHGSYERLELLGDAYIEIMATRLIFNLYPDLPAGRLSSIREKLVCNETLAAYSLAYDFASRAVIPDTYLEEGVSRAKIWTKLLGDMFEAYTAAVVVSDPEHGYERTEAWLWALWAPRLPDTDIVADPDKEAKQGLMKRVGGVGVRITYEKEKEPEPFKGGLQWFVKCVLNGWGFEDQVIGRFTGRSKQVAELGAAEDAMSNPLTAQCQAIKIKYDEKIRKKRAKAEAEAEAGAKAET